MIKLQSCCMHQNTFFSSVRVKQTRERKLFDKQINKDIMVSLSLCSCLSAPNYFSRACRRSKNKIFHRIDIDLTVHLRRNACCWDEKVLVKPFTNIVKFSVATELWQVKGSLVKWRANKTRSNPTDYCYVRDICVKKRNPYSRPKKRQNVIIDRRE